MQGVKACIHKASFGHLNVLTNVIFYIQKSSSQGPELSINSVLIN
ncbi:hypothetical protein ALTERO38_60205 [Alteromonas sp. 38]|nr:hypothetical protein ALTER154_40588 [Alteromonas sp. 154]VXC12834.1 hypothetical protein ALTERO38_60205 [Alteromonas sp. 38]